MTASATPENYTTLTDVTFEPGTKMRDRNDGRRTQWFLLDKRRRNWETPFQTFLVSFEWIDAGKLI